LLESGNFSDVTVSCADKTWKLHKAILCSRSTWFEKALTGNFSVTTSKLFPWHLCSNAYINLPQEAKTGHVDIKNFEPEAIDWLINYIYTGSKLHPFCLTVLNR